MVDDLALARAAKLGPTHAADTVSRQVSDIYRTVVGDIITSDSIAEFIRLALPIIRRGVRQADSLAGSLFRQTRRAAGVSGRAPAAPRVEFNAEQAESSLRYLGLVQPAKVAGVTYDVPFIPVDPDSVADQVGGGGARLVVNAGMESIARRAKADPKAIGYARVTQGADACYFCSMLESRGAVYTKQSFLDSDQRFAENDFPPTVLSGELAAKAHDHCRCILVPIWSRQSTVIENADRLYDTWKQVQRDYRWLAQRAGVGMIEIWRWYWDGRLDAIAAKYA